MTTCNFPNRSVVRASSPAGVGCSRQSASCKLYWNKQVGRESRNRCRVVWQPVIMGSCDDKQMAVASFYCHLWPRLKP